MKVDIVLKVDIFLKWTSGCDVDASTGEWSRGGSLSSKSSGRIINFDPLSRRLVVELTSTAITDY